MSLDALKARQKRFDEAAEAEYQKAKSVYSEIDNIIPIVLDPIGCVVLKKGSKPTPVEVPIEVVNAIRLRSLKHIAPLNQTCVRCEVKYDSYGYIIGALHHYMPDEGFDVKMPDGSLAHVEGLKEKVAKGKVKVISDYEVEIKE